MEDLLIRHAGSPAVLTILLFLGPFVLEEAALLGGAALAAAGELPAALALAALYLGVVVSDWLLYGAGMLASRFARVRSLIGEDNIAFGRKLLHRGSLTAAVTARVVPWLLLPIFVACGFLRVGFLRFAVVNAAIAFVYVNVLFWGLFQFDVLLFDTLGDRAWIAVLAVLVVVVVAARVAARRSSTTMRPDDRA